MDFGEHLADLAADGIDISVPVPRKPERRLREPYFYDDEHEEETDDGHDNTD